MLVLSRKIREQILIPALNIRVTILSVGKNRVQLGIEAPPEVHITRADAAQELGKGVRNQEPNGPKGAAHDWFLTPFPNTKIRP